MGAATKIIVGAMLLVLGLSMLGGGFLARAGLTGKYVNIVANDIWLASLIIVIAGTVPLLFVLTGSFLVWLEWEELRSSREFKQLEVAGKRRGRKNKPPSF